MKLVYFRIGDMRRAPFSTLNDGYGLPVSITLHYAGNLAEYRREFLLISFLKKRI